MKAFCLTAMIVVFLYFCTNGLQAQNEPKLDQRKTAQSSAEESVRDWYKAYLNLDSVGLFNFWAIDHPDFVYVADGKVNKREDFIKRLVSGLRNTKEMTKASILEGYPHKLSNNAYSYTSRAILEWISISGKSSSYTVTATFVLRRIKGQWKCVQCSAAHVPNSK